MFRIVVTIWIAFVWANGLKASGVDELLDRIIQANRASVGSIQSLQVTIETRSNGGSSDGRMPKANTLVAAAKFWKDSEKLRYDESNGPRRISSVSIGDRTYVRQAQVDQGREYITGAIQSSANTVRPFDPFALGLLTVWSPLAERKNSYIELSELISEPYESRQVELLHGEDESGQYCVTLHTRAKDSKIQLWVDPKTNYLARKYRYLRSGLCLLEHEIISFSEPVSSLYFPERISQRFYGKDGELIYSTETIFRDIVVNRSINAQVFEIAFQNGTIVFDEFRQEYYPVDSSGKQNGPGTPGLNRSAEITNPAGNAAGQQSSVEVSHFGRFYWISIGAIAFIVIVVSGVAMFRRLFA